MGLVHFIFNLCAFVSLILIFCYLQSKHTMAPLQIPQNFKFKFIFPILSHFQDQGSPSSTHHIPTSFKDRSSIILLFNIACENLSKRIP
jgi:hypothetical protein